MFSQTILISLLAALSAAAPTEKRYGPKFTAIAIHSGDQRVHQRSIVASDGYIYVGGETTAFDPPSGVSTGYNKETTSFNFQGSASGTPVLKLNTKNPNGEQSVFVNTQGSVFYGPPGAIADGAYVGPWEEVEGENGAAGRLTFEGEDFLACPVGVSSENYLIIAKSVHPEGVTRVNCIDIAIGTFPYDGEPAYEYKSTTA